MNLTPKQSKIFGLRCVIAEKDFAKKKIKSLEKDLKILENGSEQMQISWNCETHSSTKINLMNQIIITRGKVLGINKYRQQLIYDLEIVPPKKELNSGSLGWKAQEANTQLIKIGIF